MTPEQESAFLAPFLDTAASGGILVVGGIKRALDAHLTGSVSLASVYTLLHRHGWRKPAPAKRHPKSDPATQEAWKKARRHAACIQSGWAQRQPLKLIFQDKARFGRIADVRRC